MVQPLGTSRAPGPPPPSPSVAWRRTRPGRVGESGVEAGLWENFLQRDQLPFWTLALSLFLCFLGALLLAKEENSLKMSSFLCVRRALPPCSLPAPSHSPHRGHNFCRNEDLTADQMSWVGALGAVHTSSLNVFRAHTACPVQLCLPCCGHAGEC